MEGKGREREGKCTSLLPVKIYPDSNQTHLSLPLAQTADSKGIGHCPLSTVMPATCLVLSRIRWYIFSTINIVSAGGIQTTATETKPTSPLLKIAVTTDDSSSRSLGTYSQLRARCEVDRRFRAWEHHTMSESMPESYLRHRF